MAITITPRVTAATAISTGQMEITGPNGLTIDPTSASDDSKILFQLQDADHFTLGVDQSVTNDPLTLVRGTNLAANRIWSVADNADTFNIHSATNVTGALTVGVDDTGHDVKFFGATASRYMLWDESEDYLIFPDNVKAVFGTGGDLSIYHDSNHSYISDQGTGNIAILANDFQVNNAANNANMISATQGGAVALNHNGSTKLATHASGVEVTGSLEVATIDYTDGDLAMTIADGGAVTFSQNAIFDGNITAAGNVYGTGNYFYNYVADDSYGGYVLRNDTLDATHIYWELNKRNTNEDFWLIAYDGSAWKNVVKFDWTDGSMRLPDAPLYLGEANTDDNATIVFDGNAQDFHIGLDDSLDDLQIKTGSTVGSGTGIRINGSGMVAFNGNATLDSDGAKLFIKGGTTSTSPAGIAWTFATADTEYAYIHLDYDLRATAGEGLKMKSANGYMMTFDAGNDLAFQTDDVTRMMITNGGAITTTTSVSVMTSDTGFHGDYDNLIVGTGSGHNGITIYSGNTSNGGLIFHDAASAAISGFITYDHNVNYMYFGSEGLGRMSYSGGHNPQLRLGLGQAYDLKLLFDGNAVDYYIGLDDGTDQLYLGTGSTVGSNPAIRVNSSAQVTFDQAATFASTVSTTGYVYIYRGDTGYEGGQLSFGKAVDNSIGWSIDSFGNDANDSLRFLHASWSGTVAAQFVSSVDTFYVYHNMQVAGTTPTFIIGDGGAEDTKMVFDGNAQDFYLGLDDGTDRIMVGSGTNAGANSIMTWGHTGYIFVSSPTKSASMPQMRITNTANDNTPSYFDFWKARDGAAATSDGDYIGIIRSVFYDDGGASNVGSSLVFIANDTTAGTEDATFYIQNRHNNVNYNYMGASGLHVNLYHTGNIVMRTAAQGIEIGDGGAEDAGIIWVGNAINYYASIEDADDSFRMGTGTTLGSNTYMVVGSTGIIYFTNTNGMYVKDDVSMHWGTGADYRMRYESANTRWVMWTNDTNGSGSNEDLIRIEDGQKSIDANTTWDDNAFDAYDDAMLLASSISPTAESYDFGKGIFKRGKEALIEAGVLKRYEDDGWIGYNDQRMAALLAGGIYQTRELVDNLRNELEELKKELKEARNG